MSLPEEVLEQIKKSGEDITGVLEQLKENSGLANEFISRVVESLTFFGKSMARWEDEMVVPIPQGRISPSEIRELYSELANKIQMANHWFCLASSSTTASHSGYTLKQAELVAALVGYYNANNIKLPPTTVLDRIAENYTKQFSDLNTVTKIIKDFWREKLTTLDKVRGILDSISVSYATELKYAGTTAD